MSTGGTMEKDIALVKLAEEADCSSIYVGTACLPNPGDDYVDSTDREDESLTVQRDICYLLLLAVAVVTVVVGDVDKRF